MRFHAVRYRCFGPFEETVLDLAAGEHGLHLVHGPNEAGKSTALRGLRYLLFGFPTRITEDFRHPHGQQRIGATLTDGAARRLECLRRRGNKNTLRDGCDVEMIADDQLRGMLGHLGEEQFDMLFGLDHQRLIAGGRDIAQGQGDLGQALFEAGAGLAGIGKIAANLESQLEALYKPQGKLQAVALSLKAWNEQRDVLRKCTLHWEAWATQRRELDAASERQQALQAERTQNRAAESRLKSFYAALPVIGAWQDLKVRLAPLADARLLDEAFAAAHRDALVELQAAKQHCEEARRRAGEFDEQLAACVLDSAMLDEEGTLETLKRDLGSCQKARQDAVEISRQLNERRERAVRLLNEHFAGKPLTEADQLQVAQAEQELIRQLGGDRGAKCQAWRNALSMEQDLTVQLAAVQRSLDEAPVVPPTESLAALVKTVMQKGPLEQFADDAVAELATVKRAADETWSPIVALWPISPQEAAVAAVPASEVVAEFEAKFNDLESKARSLAAREEQLKRDRQAHERQVKQIMRGGAVPGEGDLDASRNARNRGLGHVRDLLTGRPLDEAGAAFVARFAPGREPLDALEASIGRCDELADVMRRDAGRAAELSFNQAGLEKTNDELELLAGQVEESRAERQSLGERWRQLWAPCGIPPQSAAAMRAWLAKLATALSKTSEADAVERRRQTLRSQIAAWQSRLQTELKSADEPHGKSLIEWLDLAQQRLDAATGLRQKCDELAAGVKSFVERREQSQRELQAAEAAWDDWRQKWGAAVAVIGLAADDEPAAAYRHLDRLAELAGHLSESESLEARLDGIARDLEQFLSVLSGLRTRLEPNAKLPASSADTMQHDLETLDRRWKAAASARTWRDQLLRGQEQARCDAADAAQRLAAAAMRMQALREQAGVASDEQIPQALQRSHERRSFESRFAEEQSRLHQLARGQSLEQFAAAALAERETLDDQLQRLAARVEPLDDEINSLAVAKERAERQLQAWRETDKAAAEARQQLESLAAGLREQVEEYAALHLARQVLKIAVERFRQKHQDSLLARAGHYFSLLTNQAFFDLAVEEGDDGPVLKAVRATPREEVAVEHLSDGTRDQLFLALRLAGIERHLEAGEPMPLIVDDLLVNFDDARAAATLRCLAELSRRTQVLLFTHHAHLVELAKANLPEGTLFCHDLAACARQRSELEPARTLPRRRTKKADLPSEAVTADSADERG